MLTADQTHGRLRSSHGRSPRPARRKPAGAAPVLLAYLPFADNENVADEVRAALAAVAVRDGKPDSNLVSTLKDKEPLRRAAAAEALCRSGAPELQKLTKDLLKDSDPLVRMRVALALASVKDRESIPSLIDVLGQLSSDQAWPAEDFLQHLAGDHAPGVALGQDGASRERCRKAWAEWWRQYGASVDLSRGNSTAHILGYTLLLLLQTGEAFEVDAQGRERWRVRGLQKPLDVQYLPGNRLLVAEYDANRVTERNTKGKILWEKKIEFPLVAQRLPNGNTFIATNSQLLEVSDTGGEVFSYQFPGGEQIMRARSFATEIWLAFLPAAPPEALVSFGSTAAITSCKPSPFASRPRVVESTCSPTAAFWFRRRRTIGSSSTIPPAELSGKPK